MKIKCEMTVPIGQYANIKPQISVEVPDGSTPAEIYNILKDMFAEDKKTVKEYKQPTKYQKLQARAEGADVDNDPYLDGDQDEGARQDAMKAHAEATGN